MLQNKIQTPWHSIQGFTRLGPCLCFSLQPMLFSRSSLTVPQPLQPPCFPPSRTSLFPLQNLHACCFPSPSGVFPPPALHTSGFLPLSFISSQRPSPSIQPKDPLHKHITLVYFLHSIEFVYVLFSVPSLQWKLHKTNCFVHTESLIPGTNWVLNIYLLNE